MELESGEDGECGMLAPLSAIFMERKIKCFVVQISLIILSLHAEVSTA